MNKTKYGAYSTGRQRIGKRAIVAFKRTPSDEVKVEVEVKDYKSVYGRERWLVSPVRGQGEIWVQNPQFIPS